MKKLSKEWMLENFRNSEIKSESDVAEMLNKTDAETKEKCDELSVEISKARFEYLCRDHYTPHRDCADSDFKCDFRVSFHDDLCPCQFALAKPNLEESPQ